MGTYRFDDSRYPLVVVTFLGGLTDEAFDEYLRQMSGLLTRRSKNVTLLDARDAESPSAKQRQKQAEWLKANREALKEYSLGTAFVISSAMVRGALTAILWMTPMPAAHAVVGTFDEGERWAYDQLMKAGVVLPPPPAAAAGRR
jgi:hypothetical protein